MGVDLGQILFNPSINGRIKIEKIPIAIPNLFMIG